MRTCPGGNLCSYSKKSEAGLRVALADMGGTQGRRRWLGRRGLKEEDVGIREAVAEALLLVGEQGEEVEEGEIAERKATDEGLNEGAGTAGGAIDNADAAEALANALTARQAVAENPIGRGGKEAEGDAD